MSLRAFRSRTSYFAHLQKADINGALSLIIVILVEILYKYF